MLGKSSLRMRVAQGSHSRAVCPLCLLPAKLHSPVTGSGCTGSQFSSQAGFKAEVSTPNRCNYGHSSPIATLRKQPPDQCSGLLQCTLITPGNHQLKAINVKMLLSLLSFYLAVCVPITVQHLFCFL